MKTCPTTLENFLKQNSDDTTINLINKSKKLITTCLNKIAGQTELTGKLIAINLRLDYQFREQALKGICLYDYAATIKKIPLNSRELSIITDQHLRTKNTHVDRFYFYRNDSNTTSDKTHPQCKTYIQMQRKHGTERTVILHGKGIPRRNDNKEKEYYSQMPGYAAEEELILSDNYVTYNDMNYENFDPENIIRSGLKDINVIDSIINIFQLYNVFSNTNTLQNKISSLKKYASDLNQEQKKAYYLVCNHRQRNQPINPKKLSQLLLYLYEVGRTAPTGIAATNINGITIHSACGLSFNDENYKLTKEQLKNLQKLWTNIEYIIIDEISMIEDSYNKLPLTGKNRLRFLSMLDTKDNAFCGILSLSINMKVIITVNINVNDNLANGTQGILCQIIYNKNSIDLSLLHKNILILNTSPKYVIIELMNKSPYTFQNLQPNNIPIYPIK
ncbi:7397_t:CDS:2 [Cetraspora pellucida]|uniref:ATP-dependent DNA helicase n=1 Tax=Cetraspora pellucida TaxID=1433469 RepID=A0A9N9HNK6_9GLOM|nr:7397_t:CDS:2 [Cetraspora pellucida]